ncbi:hypothetical protein [Rhizobium azibense]|uniref:hypothetical protein n=1 Tax=Rhizobium azibense TaxID=1136135 RepID=UPI001053CD34|nr:hypothetical protein [Rhizobium azibense]
MRAITPACRPLRITADPTAQIRAGNAALGAGHASLSKNFEYSFKLLNNTGNDGLRCGNPVQSLSVGRINNRLPATYIKNLMFFAMPHARGMRGGKLRVKALSILINEKLTTY